MYEGLTPLWKESLDLPFTPPMADFSPANLAQVGTVRVPRLYTSQGRQHIDQPES